MTVEPSDDPLTLFAASSSRARAFFTKDYFNWSLYYNLLFQPTGLALPDPFFSCPFLFDYFMDRTTVDAGKTWFEEGLRHGLIVPYVRDETISGFEKLWGSQVHRANPDNSKYVASRLKTLDRESRPKWQPWPSGIGERFEALVRRRMLDRQGGASAFENNQLQISFLEDIDAALAVSEQGQGLRMSAIFRASATRLLSPEYDYADKEVDDLISEVSNRYGRPSEIVSATRLFYKVLSELYNENMASAFQIANSISGYTLVSSFFGSDANEEIPINLDDIAASPFVADIKLPALRLLDDLPFQFVLNARQRDRQFGRYRDALRKWRSNPKDANAAGELSSALQEYAAYLVQTARATNPSAFRILIGTTPVVLQKIAKTAVPLLGAAAGAEVAHFITDALASFEEGAMLSWAGPVNTVLGGVVGYQLAPNLIDRGLHLIALGNERVSFTAYPSERFIELQSLQGDD